MYSNAWPLALRRAALSEPDQPAFPLIRAAMHDNCNDNPCGGGTGVGGEVARESITRPAKKKIPLDAPLRTYNPFGHGILCRNVVRGQVPLFFSGECKKGRLHGDFPRELRVKLCIS